MAYSDFTINALKQKFSLSIDEQNQLFPSINEVTPSAWLHETLKRTLSLAIQIGSEKARSEMIITPVLVEFRQMCQRQISLFSGINFNVDPALGLTGFCDFILSRSPEQLTLNVPILIAVEAKNENINAGVPQCLATMVAARIFNERASQPTPVIYGVVSTGTNWRFLKLSGEIAFVDLDEYHISQINKLLGILKAIYDDTEPLTAEQSELARKAA